jgi:hypothetical protein
MHGLINRSIQFFLRDTWGAALWSDVARDANLGFDGFEAMTTYDPSLTDAVIIAASRRLDRPRDSLLEDLGTYLVSHPDRGSLRRLLRFGGVSFADFLHSLEDLPERAHLALPDLDLPALTLMDDGSGHFILSLKAILPGVGYVVIGLLRAMADDYGALVVLSHGGTDPDGGERVSIHLLEANFAEGRRFELGLRVAR